jgi:hypothetical protein
VASIDKRPNGWYRTRSREYPGGPRKTRQFDRKGDAQQFLDGVRGDLAHGLYIDPARARTLFRDYAEAWRAGQVHRPAPRLTRRRTCDCTPTRRWVCDRSARSVAARSKPG